MLTLDCVVGTISSCQMGLMIPRIRVLIRVVPMVAVLSDSDSDPLAKRFVRQIATREDEETV